ncbi:hypothetical protein [Streptomyces canus]|uniref:hypothetical protein n=1 Tax=Streptomyces canus TaxID=58343 RepID=UPI0033A47A03
MTGAQRRAEVRAIADHLALAPVAAPRTHQILLAAAPTAGLTGARVGAAGGRPPAPPTAATGPTCAPPSPARPSPGPTASTPLLWSSARTSTGHWPYCRIMLRRLQEHYNARAQAR